MATAKLLNNILDNDPITIDTNNCKTVRDIIEKYNTEDAYANQFVEVYDTATGETTFVPLEDESSDNVSAVILVNNIEQTADYKIQPNDIINIVILPAGGVKDAFNDVVNWTKRGQTGFWGGLLGGIGGSLAGMVIGFVFGGPVGAIIGGFAGGILGTIGGFALALSAYDAANKTKKTSSLDGDSLLGIAGASNEGIVGNAFPAVLGKHLVTPYIVGSPVTISEGDYGKDQSIKVLYAVGYSPLKITDLKLDDILVSHNKSWKGNTDMRTLMNGKLCTYDPSANVNSDGIDKGDICPSWKSNELEVEIIQNNESGDMRYGTLYTGATIQEQINATPLYVIDGNLASLSTYRGVKFTNGYRNNSVRFTQSNPMSITVELEAGSGIYRSRTETDDDESVSVYKNIPCWYAIQWRPYNSNNADSDSEYGDEYSETNTSGWHCFGTLNEGTTHAVSPKTYTTAERDSDKSYHSGNDLSYVPNMNSGWIGCQLYNLGDAWNTASGDSEMRKNLSGKRFKATVNLSQADCLSLLKTAGNSSHIVEVRVVRVSPSYLDQLNGSSDTGPWSYEDTVSWTFLTTYKFDKDSLLEDTPVLKAQKPLTDANYRKLCLVAIKAKAYATSNLESQMSKFTTIAESFNPVYSDNDKTWYPASVTKTVKYEDVNGNEITKDQYINYRQAGVKAQKLKQGNDYTTQMKSLTLNANEESVLRYLKATSYDSTKTYYTEANHGVYTVASPQPTSSTFSSGTYFTLEETVYNRYLPSDTDKYTNNNAISVSMFWYLGAHAGRDAVDYAFFNLPSARDAFLFAEKVEDGSTYKTDQYDSDGNIEHAAGDKVIIRYTANSYITQAQKAETVFSQILTAARTGFYRDENNKIKYIVDDVVEFPSGMINQQNLISSNVTYSYEENPSGLVLNYADETDGYTTNQMYAMQDGEDETDPKREIEQYQIPYVTNPYQVHGLSRYVLANRILAKRVVSAKVGWEGFSNTIGDVVLFQSPMLLLGTDNGGRITRVIQDDNYIYGVQIDELYTYTGITEEDSSGNVVSTQGIEIFQPKQRNTSSVIKMRLALAGTKYKFEDEEGNTETFEQSVGQTNVVLFQNKILKDDVYDGTEGDIYYYKPEVDNIVSFGYFSGYITDQYRIIKMKPDKDWNFDLTLYPYLETFYNYGNVMPVLENHMTIPNRAAETFNLSDGTTAAEQSEYSAASMTAAIADLYSNHIVTIYKESSTQLTSEDLPTGKGTYSFKTNTFTWESTSASNGWSADYPENHSGTVYVSTATAFGKKETDDIESSEWATPIPQGLNGDNGYNTKTISLYARNNYSSALTKPDTVTYNFANDTLTGNLNSYSESIPDISGSKVLWEIHATALATTSTDTIETSEWSDPVQISDGVTAEDIKKIIEDNPSLLAQAPVVYSDNSSAGFSVDEYGYLPVTQSTEITFKVVQAGEELEFNFGTLPTIEGVSYSIDWHTLKITVASGTRLTSESITIPIVYRAYSEVNVYVDEEGNTYTDEEENPYGYFTYENEDTTFNFGYSIYGVKGGAYLNDRYTITTDDEVNNITDLVIGDYFTFMGKESSTYDYGQIYVWNGTKWEVDTSSSHSVTALRDVLSTSGETLAEKSTELADKLALNTATNEEFVGSLVANEAWVGSLTADSAFIKEIKSNKVVTDAILANTAFLTSLFSEEITVGAKDSSGNYVGSIQSLAKDSDGNPLWVIDSDGSAKFNGSVTISGYATSSEAQGYASSAESNAVSSVYSATGLSSLTDKTIITNNMLKTSLIDTDALFAKSITVKDSGYLTSQTFTDTAGWKIASDGSATFNNITARGAIKATSLTAENTLTVGSNLTIDTDGSITATNGNFTGTITATSGTFNGYIKQGVDFFALATVYITIINGVFSKIITSRYSMSLIRLDTGRFLLKIPNNIFERYSRFGIVTHYASDKSSSSYSNWYGELVSGTVNTYPAEAKYQLIVRTGNLVYDYDSYGTKIYYIPIYFTDANNDNFIDPVVTFFTVFSFTNV